MDCDRCGKHLKSNQIYNVRPVAYAEGFPEHIHDSFSLYVVLVSPYIVKVMKCSRNPLDTPLNTASKLKNTTMNNLQKRGSGFCARALQVLLLLKPIGVAKYV